VGEAVGIAVGGVAVSVGEVVASGVGEASDAAVRAITVGMVSGGYEVGKGPDALPVI